MKKWMLVAAMVVTGMLAFAACGDDAGNADGDANTEAQDDGSLPPVSDDVDTQAGSEYRLTISFNEQAVDRDDHGHGRYRQCESAALGDLV